jgi:tRNA dimethylallyltransferase
MGSAASGSEAAAGEDRLLVIVGATASGKSRVAAELARRLPGEVISCDASCVYRGMDVGTAKPPVALREAVRHHLVDVADPREGFSAARFAELAEEAVRSVRARGLVPIVAGGTGLYLRALLRGIVASPVDRGLRERLQRREEARPGSMHRLLRRLDAPLAARLRPADRLRALRGVEHRLLTGRRLSESQREWAGPERHATLKVGLAVPRAGRAVLVRRRVEEMLQEGLVEEVRALLRSGVPADAPGMQAIGYADVVRHLCGEMSRDELVERMVRATLRYAKRQDTWFRREPAVRWMEAPGDELALPRLVDAVMLLWRGSGDSGGHPATWCSGPETR